MQLSFLDQIPTPPAAPRLLADGAYWLPGFVENPATLLANIDQITATAPFRRMAVPGGQSMSVAMTSCGALGWITDRTGYRYSARDPLSGKQWPAMPDSFLSLAQAAASAGGFPGFQPNACLINRYAQGAKMGLHQDRDEGGMTAPIVSVSLGLPATFLFGGATREAPRQKIILTSGDVVVWGGASRLAFHGVLPVRDGDHPLTGHARINLTFRCVGARVTDDYDFSGNAV